MSAIYSKKVMEHFLNPRHMGKLDNPEGVSSTENLRCGDIMKIYLKVKDNKITAISFETLGCAAAIATTDMICDLAKGKTLDQASKIKFQDVATELGNLPSAKIHCARLAQTALTSAINDYKNKAKEK